MKVAATIGLLALLVPGHALAAPPKPKPNVLVILTDDQRADGTLDVMPQTRRRLAHQGVTFTNAYVTTPKCCPSRASYFTGRYIHNHGVISNSRAQSLDQRTTVQYLLHRRGYRTGLFGKFLNSWPVEFTPAYWDDWAISNGGYEDVYWNIDGRVRTEHQYSTDLIANHAARFIRQSERLDDDRPWLAWVTPYAPHYPSTPARRHEDAHLPPFPLTPAMGEEDFSDKPPFLDNARNDDETLATVRDDGRRSLKAVDEMVARLTDEIRELKEYDNTLVIFASDNGFMLGEHGGVVGKDLPYPASTRIPMIARWPHHLRRNRENRKFVANIDVAPTLFEAAGIHKQTDGRSLLAAGRRRHIFTESRGSYNEDGARSLPAFRSVTTPTYRYAEYYRSGSYDLLFREYYDLSIDPWELDNRAPELDPARIDELSAMLQQDGTCRGRSCP